MLKKKNLVKPLVINNDNVVVSDIDDTLIGWGPAPSDRKTWVEIKIEDRIEHHWVLEENVEQLHHHAKRGQPIIFWSQGGSEWANAVVEALGLNGIATVVMSKPKFVIDDLPSSAWMPASRLAERKK